MLTANTTKEALRECEEAGVDAYLTKPINAKKLIATIHILTESTDSVTNSCRNTQVSNSGNVTSISNDGVINFDIVNSIISLSDDNGFTNTLINGFYSDTEKLLEEMEKALARNNHVEFLDHAHALKGSAGSIGACKIHDYCKTLLLNETDCSEYIPILRELISAFKDTRIKLDAYILNKEINVS